MRAGEESGGAGDGGGRVSRWYCLTCGLCVGRRGCEGQGTSKEN
jgi:hypothetical protein